jgi:hypothetical protein
MSDQNRNTYCKRLGIAVPRPEELLGQREPKLFELTVVILLEYGGPMSPDDLCARISATGCETRAPDLRQSVLQAWRGMQPVYRNAQGEFGLNRSELRFAKLIRMSREV